MKLFHPSGILRSDRDGGQNVPPLFGQRLYYRKPVQAQFSWRNQGGATETLLEDGNLFLSDPAGAGHNLRIREKTAPSTPYTITGIFSPLAFTFDTNYLYAGLCWVENSSGKVITWNWRSDGTVEFSRWTNVTTFSAPILAATAWIPQTEGICFRIQDDGTNLYVYLSNDGLNWFAVTAEGRTAFMAGGPDRVGYFVNSNNADYAAAMSLASWREA